MRFRILGLAVAAFVLRVAVGLSLVGTQGGDALEYERIGHNLADGHGYSLAAAPPFAPTDFRLPGYPAVLALVDLVGGSNTALVIANSLLGAAAVAILVLIANRVFPDRPVLGIWVGALAVVYPAFVTFTGVAYSENLAIPAVCVFIYATFLSRAPRTSWRWILPVAATGAVVALTRPEGIALVALGLIASAVLRRPPLLLALAAVAATAVAPVAWAIRNDIEVHRFEFSDPTSRDVTLLLSTNDGDVHDPLYLRGFQLGYDGTSSASQRQTYHREVTSSIRHALKTNRNHVFVYKAKSLFNFPFVPVVWTWSSAHDYSFTEAAQDLTGRNLLRVAWSFLLVIEYGLAVFGLVTWWRHRERGRVIAFALYPTLAVALAVPFHSELRLWFAAAALLLVPAVEGASQLVKRRSPMAASPRERPAAPGPVAR
jgi:hypothetical protein